MEEASMRGDVELAAIVIAAGLVISALILSLAIVLAARRIKKQ
jgi:hypothetical protein